MSKICKSITANVHILNISERKLEESFLSAQFAIEGSNKLRAIVHELMPFFGSPQRTKHNIDF